MLGGMMSILGRFSLKGRTALVTGGGRGIGGSLAVALAEAGADVAVADLDFSTAQETSERIKSLGVRSIAIQVEVTNAMSTADMVKAAVDAWGRLDVAVNSAGVARRSSAEDMSEEDWDFVVDINLKGIFLSTREEAKVMLKQGWGSIINIASMSGQIVNRPQQHAHYNAAKAGVIQYSRTCAAEWAARGVRVNTLSPGHTISPMTAESLDTMSATWLSNTPMGRLGKPEDLQGAIVFLASDASTYVTGHDLVVDGGYTLW
jgi:NAD(P)-dependent dehydrogenase (short-subunit alcohol dehydrogenase family)